MKRLALLLLSLLALAGCGKGVHEEPGPEVPPSAYISGSLLEVRLESIPGTGFTWTWAQEGDGRLTEESREPIVPTDPLRHGTGETSLFTFAPETPGEARLLFVLARPWEDKDPIETFTVDFIVSETADGLTVNLR